MMTAQKDSRTFVRVHIASGFSGGSAWLEGLVLGASASVLAMVLAVVVPVFSFTTGASPSGLALDIDVPLIEV